MEKIVYLNIAMLLFIIGEHFIIKVRRYDTSSSLERLIAMRSSPKNDLLFWVLAQTIFPIAKKLGILSLFSAFGLLSFLLQETLGIDIFKYSILRAHMEWVNLYPLLNWFVWFVVIDFVGYCNHYLMHRFFWRWHQFHHAAEEFCVLNTVRFALSENLLGSFMIGLVTIGLLGLPDYQTISILVLIKLVFEWQHSNLPWDYGRLGMVFVSPRFHRLHHSRLVEDRDVNFGAVLAIWDYLFNTVSKRYVRDPSLASTIPIGIDRCDYRTLGEFFHGYLPEISWLKSLVSKIIRTARHPY